MRILICLILSNLLFSCAQRIKVPINRFHSPEVIGGGAEFEYRQVGFSSGVLDFTNSNTNNALTMGTSKDDEFYLGVGLSPSVDLFVRVPEESSSLLGIKIQLLGGGIKDAGDGHKLALTLGMGSERDTFDQTFQIELKSDVTDYSIVHGYRFHSKFLVYEGISISNYSFEGRVLGTTGLNSDQIDYSAQNILGAHAGAVIGGAGLKLKIEIAAQKIEWSNTESKLYQSFGVALSAGW